MFFFSDILLCRPYCWRVPQPSAPLGVCLPFCQLLDTPLVASASALLHTSFAPPFVSARSSPNRRLTGVFYVSAIYKQDQKCGNLGSCIFAVTCNKWVKLDSKFIKFRNGGRRNCPNKHHVCCEGEQITYLVWGRLVMIFICVASIISFFEVINALHCHLL